MVVASTYTRATFERLHRGAPNSLDKPHRSWCAQGFNADMAALARIALAALLGRNKFNGKGIAPAFM